jgi:hypothetical protein
MFVLVPRGRQQEEVKRPLRFPARDLPQDFAHQRLREPPGSSKGRE